MTTEHPLELASTVHEVARAAGVSASTVSRFLNGTAKVSEAKRKTIEGAIERLNYKPNMLAQGLKRGSSKTIGILTQSLTSAFFNEALIGVEDALIGTGYAPLIVSGHWHAREEADKIELLIARRVDGIVILTGDMTDQQILDFSSRVPIVATGRHIQGRHAFGFSFDNFQAAKNACEYLIELGHRRIAFIAGLEGHKDAQARLAGYLAALEAHDIAHDPALVVPGDFLESGGLLAVNQLLSAGQRFSAIFAANDQTAYGARLALYRRGIRVPEDVSIVGFDDLPGSM
ncbi:MAG: LacI family DNA-binding transcriptional regulator, partial [Pseudomonadota bacterium]